VRDRARRRDLDAPAVLESLDDLRAELGGGVLAEGGEHRLADEPLDDLELVVALDGLDLELADRRGDQRLEVARRGTAADSERRTARRTAAATRVS